MECQIDNKLLGNLSIYELICDKSKVKISTFGAQAISWQIEDKDIYFSNPNLIIDKSKALRSGAPVCFPWFNKGLNWNLGKEIAPSHGSARISDWSVEETKISDQSVSIRLSFETVSHLNLPLKISVSYTLEASQLKSDFSVKNLSSTTKNSFELALHSYFKTKTPELSKIAGLKEFPSNDFSPIIPIDQIFENQGSKVNLSFNEYSLEINNIGFTKSVVWHPGITHQIADLAIETSPSPFLCVESLTNLMTINALEQWNGRISYNATLPNKL